MNCIMDLEWVAEWESETGLNWVVAEWDENRMLLVSETNFNWTFSENEKVKQTES